ncbi:hypothetical protein, partial [Pseudomonas aeruginosa]|uniref:hypothetical protein n=1 Tax=Pseudomonas aeruginosa TaxID=287 RepID=UPI000996F07D
SKIEQKQLNTWVSFQSAEQPLLGQFSVSGNTVANPQQYQSKPPVSRVKKDATLRPFFHGFACRPATADSKYSSKCHPLETVR